MFPHHSSAVHPSQSSLPVSWETKSNGICISKLSVSMIPEIYLPPSDDDHPVELKDDDPTAPLSRFSLSSIHGYPPNFPWQGGGEKHHGYCAHSEVGVGMVSCSRCILMMAYL